MDNKRRAELDAVTVKQIREFEEKILQKEIETLVAFCIQRKIYEIDEQVKKIKSRLEVLNDIDAYAGLPIAFG